MSLVCSVGVLLAGLHLDVGDGTTALDALDELCRRDARARRRRRSRRTRPAVSNSCWAVGRSTRRPSRRRATSTSPNLKMPTMRRPAAAGVRGRPDAARPTVMCSSSAVFLIDRDLAAALRAAALRRSSSGLNGLLGVREDAARRAALPTDHLAVDDELRRCRRSRPRPRPRRRPCAHLADQRLGQRRRRRRCSVLNAALRVSTASVPGVGRLEDVVEGVVDLVRQDERAGDHRDAEQDRERRSGPCAACGSASPRSDQLAHLLERLHDVEDLVGREVLAVRDDQAVGEEHDAVGDRGRARVVRDHHDRLAVLVDRAAQQLEDLGAGVPSRGCPSARRRTARPAGEASARAMATRCCWPPESSRRAVREAVAQADGVDQLRRPSRVGLARRRCDSGSSMFSLGRRASAAG